MLRISYLMTTYCIFLSTLGFQINVQVFCLIMKKMSDSTFKQQRDLPLCRHSSATSEYSGLYSEIALECLLSGKSGNFVA